MKTFEYTVRRNMDVVDLNEMGRQGWELVAVTVDNPSQISSPVFFYFKKEKPE